MADMEFLKQNFINTTSSIFGTPAGATSGTESFLFDNNKSLAWGSSGFESGTGLAIEIEFANPTVISHCVLLNHNIRTAQLYYDSVSTNTLTAIASNSATSTYLSFASVTVSSVTLFMQNTIPGLTEYSIGELIWSERQLVFERNPSTKDFTPAVKRTKVTHKMPDGGVTIFNIQDKFKADLKWKFVTTSFRDDLRTVYDSADPYVFIPFPTTTSWDGGAFEVVWTNDFDFKNSDNAKTQGFEGKIRLEETPSA